MNVISGIMSRHQKVTTEELTLEKYLNICRENPLAYASAAERLLGAISKPKLIDTSLHPRLSRIFYDQIIKYYPTFEEFYGLEDPIEQIVSFLKHASQGLEERKQILYLLGPVGSGKSSLAEKLKSLMQRAPFYTLKGSPIFESPLGLFDKDIDGELLEKEYGIPIRYLESRMSPWAIKRLNEYDGNINKFKVIKIYPDMNKQIAIAKTEPGDENNQDISSLVGKMDIRKLEHFAQDDPDAYSFSGGLCKANRGLLEFVEMFKAPIKILHPLLTATQEGNYNGTEAISSIPFDGIIIAHSNEAEWQSFKNNKHNEAFLDRVYTVKVPYCLRISDETKIYKRLIQNSSLKNSPVAPRTLEMMAEFAILTRLKTPKNSSIYAKMKIYDGINLKDVDPRAKSIIEYKRDAGVNEGMTGCSTRFAFKVLAKVFNKDVNEIGANPVDLLEILEKQIEHEEYPQEISEQYLTFINGYLKPKYIEYIGREIQKTLIESYSDYGQNIFEKYIKFAQFWLENANHFTLNNIEEQKTLKDTLTGKHITLLKINEKLEEIENLAGIINKREFRSEIVNFVNRIRNLQDSNSKVSKKLPHWTSYEKIKIVIEKKIFSQINELLPIISFKEIITDTNIQNTSDPLAKTEIVPIQNSIQNKQKQFLNSMLKKGYTKKQITLICDWYLKVYNAI